METFSSNIEVEVDNQSFGKATLKWGVGFISREYGFAIIYPTISPQKIDLTQGLNKYKDDMEYDLEYIEEARESNSLDPHDIRMLATYERLKNLDNIEINEFEICIETTNQESTSIGLHVNKMEIDSINKKAKVYFSGHSS
jgi:hypothetical protein